MELISRVGAVVDDCLYCSLRYANGLFKTNLKTGENKFLSFFDNQSILQSGLHRDCKKVGDLLCFAPESNGIMNIYNYRTNTMKSVNCSGAASLFCCDDLLWYIPCRGGDFLAFQEDSFECKKYRPVGYDNIDTFCQCGDGILYGFVDSHYIWILIDNTSKICCYDTRTNKIKLFDTGVQSLITISKGNDGIWLVPKYGARIILWNPKDGTKKHLNVME